MRIKPKIAASSSNNGTTWSNNPPTHIPLSPSLCIDDYSDPHSLSYSSLLVLRRLLLLPHSVFSRFSGFPLIALLGLMEKGEIDFGDGDDQRGLLEDLGRKGNDQYRSQEEEDGQKVSRRCSSDLESE